MTSIRREILSLSEKYSLKCMETAQLEEQLSSSSRQLQHSQQLVSELETRLVILMKYPPPPSFFLCVVFGLVIKTFWLPCSTSNFYYPLLCKRVFKIYEHYKMFFFYRNQQLRQHLISDTRSDSRSDTRSDTMVGPESPCSAVSDSFLLQSVSC